MPTPTFIHGLKTVVYLGALNLTSWFTDAEVDQKVDTADTSTFGSSAHSYLPGLKDGDVSLAGLFDGQANAVDSQLSTMLGVSTVCTVGIGGDTQPDGTTHLVTAPAKLLGGGLETDYKIGAKIASAVTVNASMKASGGVDNGAFLQSGAAALSGLTNDNYLDNSAQTTNGYAANIHVLAVTGSPTTVTFRITDSADHVTFAPMASPCTFNNAVSTFAQQVTGTGTVRQYVRAELSALSGGVSPTVTAAIAFARR